MFRRSLARQNGLSREVDRIAELTEEFRNTLDGIREGKDGLERLHRSAAAGLDQQRRRIDEWVQRADRSVERAERSQVDVEDRLQQLQGAVHDSEQRAELREREVRSTVEEVRRKTAESLDRIEATLGRWAADSTVQSRRVTDLERAAQQTIHALEGLVAHRDHSLQRHHELESALARAGTELSRTIEAHRRKTNLALLCLTIFTLTLAIVVVVSRTRV